MKITAAAESDFQTVKDITQQTIKAVYPHYYPKGAVNFFLAHHSDEKIMRDIRSGDVFLLYTDNNEAAGTVTTEKNEINRLFVLPEYQGQASAELSCSLPRSVSPRIMILQSFPYLCLQRLFISKKAMFLRNTARSRPKTAIICALTIWRSPC